MLTERKKEVERIMDSIENDAMFVQVMEVIESNKLSRLQKIWSDAHDILPYRRLIHDACMESVGQPHIIRWLKMKLAVQCGADLELLEELWSDPEASTEEEISQRHWLIHDACLHGHLHVAKWLVNEKGIDIHYEHEENGHSPLRYACQGGSLGVVKWLVIDKQASMDDVDMWQWEDISALSVACYYNQIHIARWLVDEMEQKIHSKDEKGLTPLIHACMGGALDVVKWLIMDKQAHISMHEANEKAADEKWGIAPMIGACSNHGCLHVAQWLVDEVKVNVHTTTSTEGRSLLVDACRGGDLDVVKWLVLEKHADVNKATIHGQTPIFYACSGNNLHVAKWLVDVMNVSVNVKDEKGETPLFWACHYESDLDIVKWLINEKQLDADQMNYSNETPMIMACGYKNPHIVKWLIENMNVNIHVKDHFGQTPLFLQCIWSNNYSPMYIDVANVLLEHGATIEALKFPYYDCSKEAKNLLEQTKKQRSNPTYLKQHVSKYPSMLADAPKELQQNYDLLLLALGSNSSISDDATTTTTSINNNGSSSCDDDSNNDNKKKKNPYYHYGIKYYLKEEHYKGQHAFMRQFYYTTILEQIDLHVAFSTFLCGVILSPPYEEVEEEVLVSEETKSKNEVEEEDSSSMMMMRSRCLLPFLNQGMVTNHTIFKLIADFAGIKHDGKMDYFNLLCSVQKNINEMLPYMIDPIPEVKDPDEVISRRCAC